MGRIYKRNIKYYLNNNKEGGTDIYISEKTSGNAGASPNHTLYGTADADVHYIWHGADSKEAMYDQPLDNFIIPQLNEQFDAKALENFYGSQRLRLQESTGDIRYLYDYKKDTIETSYYDGAMWLKVN